MALASDLQQRAVSGKRFWPVRDGGSVAVRGSESPTHMSPSDERASDIEYRRGDHITYRQGKHTHTGKIVWVISPSQLMGHSPPTRYIVERDGYSGVIPDEVSPADIVSKEKRATSMNAPAEQFEDIYGLLPSYSDYKKGDRITYRLSGDTYTGAVMWVRGPGNVAGKHLPTHYTVARDDAGNSPPDTVWQADIVGDANNNDTCEPLEPAIVQCPFCGDLHYADQVKLCPKNPRREK